MPDRRIFSWYFEPVVQINEHVLLVTPEGRIPARVTWIEPIPWIEVDFGPINAGNLTDEREMKELYVADDEFAQYRMRILTDNIILYRHACPKATTYYATEKAYPRIPPASTYDAIDALKRDQLTEFYQYKDIKRYMQLRNVGATDVAESKVAFFGYVFEIEKLTRIEKPYTVIPCMARKAKAGPSSKGSKSSKS